MKTAQLSSVRVAPALRGQIEGMLQEGESLTQFVEEATLEAVHWRKAQQEIIARGCASLVKARRTGELHAADEVLNAMRARLNARLAALNRPALSSVNTFEPDAIRMTRAASQAGTRPT